MLDFVDEYFSTLTPSSAMFAPSKTRVFLRLKSLQSASSLPHNPPRIMHERRGRKRDFNIFVDTTAEDSSPGPASTRPRTNESRPRTDEFGFNEEAASPGLTFTRSRAYGRHPLSVRSDSANSTPAPSPHPPGTPSFRPREDLGLLNQENHDPAPVTTFPSTTTTFPNLPTGTGPPPPPSEAPHIIRSPPTYGLQPPRNTELYDLLGLDDWDVSKADVRSAFRRAALNIHPDRVPEEEREAATEKMQKMNAAKEVLTNSRRRRQYHVDGVLPWAI